MDDQVIRLLLDMGKSGKNVDEAREAVEKLKTKLDAVPDATDKASKGIGNMGQAALQGSRALQDFTQGGLAGVLNNIEGVVQALGGGPGLTGILTGVGVAAYIALPKAKALFDAIVSGANEVPKTTDKLERLNEEIKAGAKALDELKQKQSLTNAELREYGKLTERQVELEKQLAAEKQKRKEAEEVKGLKPFGQKEAEGERTEAMKTLLGDEKDRKKLVDEATKHVESIYDTQDWKKIGPTNKAILGELGGSFKPGMTHEQNVRAAIEQTMNRAITGGNEADIRKLTGFLPPGSKLRSHIEESTLPENLRRQQAEIDAEAEHFGKVSSANKARHAHERRMGREGKVHGKIIDQMGDQAESDREKAEAKEGRDIQAQIRASRRAVVQGGGIGGGIGIGGGGGLGGGGGHGGGAEIPLGHATILRPGATEMDLEHAALENQLQGQANMMALDGMPAPPRRPIVGPRRAPRLAGGWRAPLGVQHLPGGPSLVTGQGQGQGEGHEAMHLSAAAKQIATGQAAVTKAQAEAAGAMMAAVQEQQRQAAILKGLAAKLRKGADQGVMPGGLPR